MKRRGFTLIELMIVVVIIGILAAIAIPKFGAVRDQAQQAACHSNMRSLASAEAMYYGKENTYCDAAGLVSSGVMDNAADVACPIGNTDYNYAADSLTYSITCAAGGPADYPHGSIDDGIMSWQGE